MSTKKLKLKNENSFIVIREIKNTLCIHVSIDINTLLNGNEENKKLGNTKKPIMFLDKKRKYGNVSMKIIHIKLRKM